MDDHPALAVARRYFDVYASGDHDAIAACLTDDVVWVIHGHTRIEGKAAYLVEVDRTGPDVVSRSPPIVISATATTWSPSVASWRRRPTARSCASCSPTSCTRATA